MTPFLYFAYHSYGPLLIAFSVYYGIAFFGVLFRKAEDWLKHK